MMDYLEYLVNRHKAGGVLIDSNLLLLLLAGVHDRSLIARLKRFNTYVRCRFRQSRNLEPEPILKRKTIDP